MAGDRSGALHVVQKVPFILQPALPSSCMLPLLSCSFSSLCFIASILDCELRKAPVFSMRLLRFATGTSSKWLCCRGYFSCAKVEISFELSLMLVLVMPSVVIIGQAGSYVGKRQQQLGL